MESIGIVMCVSIYRKGHTRMDEGIERTNSLLDGKGPASKREKFFRVWRLWWCGRLKPTAMPKDQKCDGDGGQKEKRVAAGKGGKEGKDKGDDWRGRG
jgi:hypothetical protein